MSVDRTMGRGEAQRERIIEIADAGNLIDVQWVIDGHPYRLTPHELWCDGDRLFRRDESETFEEFLGEWIPSGVVVTINHKTEV